MTHPILKEPLEKWVQGFLLWLMVVAMWLGLDRLYKRKKAKVYHGGALLLPEYDSGKYQTALAAAIVWARGSGAARNHDPAIFIQKIREWTDYNLSRSKRDPRPYNSYQDWCDEQFPCHNKASIARLVQMLEPGEDGLGLIITEQDPTCGDRKRYAVNESAVQALMDRWAAAHPEIARKFRGETRRLDTESPRIAKDSARLDIESPRIGSESGRRESESARIGIVPHTSSNQSTKHNLKSQWSNQGRSTSDRGGAVRSLSAALMEIESHSHMHESGETDLKEHSALDAEHQAEERTTPLPSSEAPLSPLDQPISSTSGMTPRKVWDTAHHQLSLLFDRPSFEMWLKNAVLLSYEGECYTVGVPTAHAQDMLQHRYYRNVQRVVQGLQNQPVEITFQVYTPPPLPAHPDLDEDAPLLRLLAMPQTTNERTPYRRRSY